MTDWTPFELRQLEKTSEAYPEQGPQATTGEVPTGFVPEYRSTQELGERCKWAKVKR